MTKVRQILERSPPAGRSSSARRQGNARIEKPVVSGPRGGVEVGDTGRSPSRSAGQA